MGSVTVGAGAAAGVFERESDLMAENRSAMSTQARPAAWQRAAHQAPRPAVRAGETRSPPAGRATARRMCQGVRGARR
jgi:3-hydroxy-3-methylglutaryl CoA synthase